MEQEVYTDLEQIKEFAAIEEAAGPLADAHMYEWLFHFNPHTQLWNAIPRDLQNEYWNNHTLADVLRSKHLNTLLDMIHRTKGDKGLIEDLTRGEFK